MTTRLEIGTCMGKEHYAVIGTPNDFYVWARENGDRGDNSQWIVGRAAFELYNKLRRLHERQEKQEFVALIKSTYDKHRKKQ